MPLTLLCGPANSGKVRAVIDRVLAACEAHGGAWLLVPTRADIVRAQREVAGRTGLALGLRIGTFHHLARELSVAADAAGAAGDDLDPAAAALLVRHLAARAGVSSAVLQYPSAGRAVAVQLAELRSLAAAGEEQLNVRLGELVPQERRVWRRLLEAWAALADEGLARDTAWHEARALELVQAGDAPGMVPVHAYGFDDLAPAQLALVEAIARHVDVTLSLPFVPGRLVFERRQSLVDRLVGAGALLVDGGRATFRSPVLAALEQRLYEPTADPVSGAAQDDAVRFVECSGELQQAEAVVHEVAELVRAGVPAGSIACLAGSPARSRPVLEAAFRRAGVPVTFEVPRQLRDVPAGRAVLDLLDAALHEDDGRFAAFALSRVCAELFDRRTVMEWELSTRRHVPLPGSRWHEQAWVPMPIRALQAAAAGGTRGPQLVGLVRAAIDCLCGGSAGDVRLLAAIDSLLARLGDVAGHAGLAPGTGDLRAAIAAMPIPAPELRPDGTVVVAPITRVRTDRFEAVVLYDLHTGGLATSHEQHEAPLVARELTYIACTRAWRFLRFVRQASGSDGRLRTAHPAWTELRRLLPDGDLVRRGPDDVVGEPGHAVLASELRLSLARSGASPVCAGRETSVDPGQLHGAAAGPVALRVTDVETYAQCPSRWFVQRHLLRRDPAGPTRRQVVGMLVHEALAVAVPQLHGEVDDLDALVDEALTTGASRLRPRPGVVERARARAIVRRFLADERPTGVSTLTELPFGADDADALPALVIDGAQLSGRIDRVDVDEQGRAFVHDYKLSRTAIAGAKLVREGRLQLPLYWLALQEAGREPLGALYRPLESDRPRGMLAADAPGVEGEFRTDRFDDVQLDELLDEVRAAATAAVAGIREGIVAPAPLGGSCPSWCDLQSICRVEAR